jgi:diadenosine tetraphosphate (Ap4A) HIT family hydrolase
MNEYFFETAYWKIILADDQRYVGRLVIKTKESRQALPDLTKEEQMDFFSLIAKLETFFKEKFGATMFNYSCLMNHAYRDGEAPHVHFHFRPRYQSPVVVLGHEYMDPNFGEHYLSPTLNGNGDVIVPDEVRAYIMKELKTFLQ